MAYEIDLGSLVDVTGGQARRRDAHRKPTVAHCDGSSSMGMYHSLARRMADRKRCELNGGG